MRRKAKKLDFDRNSIKDTMQWHKKHCDFFKVIISSYTYKVISEHGEFYFFRGFKSKRCFIAYKMIQKDCKGNKLPEINEHNLKYYETALTNIFLDFVNLTDIKSAYANILFNEKIISEKSFNYLCALPKEDRLAAVGMLATRNTTFEFCREKILHTYNFISPDSNVFFYAVNKTYYVMKECKQAIGKDFLFSWVDCIYYGTEHSGNIIAECLNDYHLQYKQNKISSFECEELKVSFRLNYKEENNKSVAFYIPKIYNKMVV